MAPRGHGSYYSQQKPAFKEKLRARYADYFMCSYFSYMTAKTQRLCRILSAQNARYREQISFCHLSDILQVLTYPQEKS
jgi:hypothetical protein